MSKQNLRKKPAKPPVKGKVAAKKKATKKPDPPAKVAVSRKVAPKNAGEKGSRTPSKVDLFVIEYLVDLNGRQAAIRAGYGADGARQRAAEMLATKPVQDAIAEAMLERAERTGITQDRVLERWWAVATADARELTEVHRICCRHCWGFQHHYQWTPQSLRDALDEYRRQIDACTDELAKKKIRVVDQTGGTGYDPRKDPNPACPECFGSGIEQVVAKDTRDLSPAGRLLYAGVKSTQHGIEVKSHSQGDALVNVAKHIGMLATRMRVGATDDPAEDQDAVGYVLIPAKRKRSDAEAD